MENVLLISDAAKEVQVESHVLRYWEEELQLPIQRNEQGHRYYTDVDVERFKKIKSMKESGLQLKAIKMILKNGKMDMLPAKAPETTDFYGRMEEKAVDELGESREQKAVEEPGESREQKAKRLQWVMQQLIRQAVQENNEELLRQIRESVLKELDYQFRMQEEREEQRDRKAIEREEQHYRQIDELIRQKAGKKKTRREKKKEQGMAKGQVKAQEKQDKILHMQERRQDNVSAKNTLEKSKKEEPENKSGKKKFLFLSI